MEDLLFNCSNWPFWFGFSALTWLLYIIADHYASKTENGSRHRSCRKFCTGKCGVYCDCRPQGEVA